MFDFDRFVSSFPSFILFFELSKTYLRSTIMEVAKANDTASSLVEQSNVESALKSVKTLQSTQSVQTKSVIESSTSIKSVTTSSSRSHRSMEYEESVEYTDE